jgi:hypothetical protein
MRTIIDMAWALFPAAAGHAGEDRDDWAGSSPQRLKNLKWIRDVFTGHKPIPLAQAEQVNGVEPA